MARCSCSGSVCNCLLLGGLRVTVSGGGTSGQPYQIEANELLGLLQTVDTSTVSLALGGRGSPQSPFTLYGWVEPSLHSLADRSATGVAAAGTTPIVNTGATTWNFANLPPAPAGAVNTTDGLTGQGTSGAPVQVAVSGVWGQGVLAGLGADSTIGDEVWVQIGNLFRPAPRFTTWIRKGYAYSTGGQRQLWTRTRGSLKSIRVSIQGGGAAGGGAAAVQGFYEASAGGGGGGGGYTEFTINAVDLPAEAMFVDVGAGGVGVVGGVGGDGGETQISWPTSGTTYSVPGGRGGSAGTRVDASTLTRMAVTAGGEGGAPTSGAMQQSGGAGGLAFIVPPPAGQAPLAVAGAGGTAQNGPLTAAIEPYITVGHDGRGLGAGGSGMLNLNTQAARAGFAGAPGSVIIEEFY